ncbi:MAG: peroxide stress protein YaaA [Pseudomonadota bacterium]
MLAIVSPAKTLDFESPLQTRKYTTPEFVTESTQLIKTLKTYAPADIASLMGISDKLAELNHRRYHEWRADFADNKEATRPAIQAFKGDVYLGLDAASLSVRDLTWAQKHLRILSGLHGLLRPLDRIRPYRLEMGTRLANARGDNLYDFWGGKITQALNCAISEQKQPILINLASNEYYRAIHEGKVKARIININFKERRDGEYRFLSFSAKKARGLMARYMIDKRVKTLKALRDFDYEGYSLNPQLTVGDNWVFTRSQVT